MVDRAGVSASFSSLRVPAYRRLWWAGTFSFMAVQMQFLLRGVLAWDLTGREGALGLVYLCFGVSMLIATPLGGVAADRLPKRRVMVVSQAVLLIGAVGMGTVVVMDVEQIWMLFIAAVFQGTAFGFYGPARVAFTSEIVGRDQLGNAITLSLLSMNGTRVIAPAFAGALAGIALVGIGGAYLISAAFSVIALVMLLRCPPGSVPEGLPPARPLAEIADGVRYVIARRRLRRLVLASFVVIMFGFNYVAFVPALVKGTFSLGDGYVGILMSASSVGAVVVSLSLASRADGAGAWRLMIITGVMFGTGVIALGVSPTFAVAVVVVAVIGAGATGFQSLSNTIALNMSEDSHQGRVQSLLMLSFAGFGIAAAPLGFLAELVGLRLAMVLMGVMALVGLGLYVLFERADRFPRGPRGELGEESPDSVPVAGS
jgi:MFS family permease